MHVFFVDNLAYKKLYYYYYQLDTLCITAYYYHDIVYESGKSSQLNNQQHYGYTFIGKVIYIMQHAEKQIIT